MRCNTGLANIIFLLLIACQQQKKIDVHLIPISLPDSLWSIYDLDSDDNHLYILDKDRFSFWILTKNGQEVKESSLSKGKGPGEFINPIDLAVSKDKIFVIDDMSRRVSYFDTSGSFIESFNINPRPFGIFADNDSVYICGIDPSTNKSVHLFDLKGNNIESYIYPLSVPQEYKNFFTDAGINLLTPANWLIKGDTIWIANRFFYEIKSFKKDTEIMTLRGNDELIRMPNISRKEIEESFAITMQYYCYIKMAIKDSLLYIAIDGIYSNYDVKPPDMRSYLQIYNIKTKKLIAERFVRPKPDSEVPLFQGCYNNNFYYSTGYKLFRAEIFVK